MFVSTTVPPPGVQLFIYYLFVCVCVSLCLCVHGCVRMTNHTHIATHQISKRTPSPSLAHSSFASCFFHFSSSFILPPSSSCLFLPVLMSPPLSSYFFLFLPSLVIVPNLLPVLLLVSSPLPRTSFPTFF